jgi:TonB family protein
MINIVNYITEANLALLIILLVYRLLLINETRFGLMRLFLLAGALLSVTLPFFHFTHDTSYSGSMFNNIFPTFQLPEIVITDTASPSDRTDISLPWKMAGIIYCGGASFFLLKFLLELTALFRLLRNSKTYRLNGLIIAESKNSLPTFSFFRCIHIGNSDLLSSNEKQQIMNHETVHARQLHSLDILLVNVLQVVFWFNPFITLFKKYFIQLHEFEADARAVMSSDADKYCNLLARVALKSADYSIANHFNNSLTLKRINMIRTIKRKTSQWRMLAATFVFPMLFFVLGFQDQVIAQQVKPAIPASASSEVYSSVDEMPSYKQGFDDLASFIGQTMKYPKEARTKKVEGVVYTEFVVEKDGKLSDVKVVKGIGSGCDEEALRVVKAMTDWNPGVLEGKAVRTKMVLPLKFKLN